MNIEEQQVKQNRPKNNNKAHKGYGLTKCRGAQSKHKMKNPRN